jgi:putative transposase
MPNRKHPTHGVSFDETDFPIIFLTVCTKARRPWLASEDVHRLLCNTWRHATAWLVGRYVVMPDHVHLFAAPGSQPVPLDNWVRY